MATRPDHAPADHPTIARRKSAFLLPTSARRTHDYWPMRRYLNEFLSDQRVIDYPAWKWQPLAAADHPDQAPVFTSGAAYRTIWNTDADESPLMTITKAQTEAHRTRRHRR